MLDKLKQLRELKTWRDNLKKESVTVIKDGVMVTINGELEVINLQLNPELETAKQAEVLKRCLNDARLQIQIKIAKNFQGQMPSF